MANFDGAILIRARKSEIKRWQRAAEMALADDFASWARAVLRRAADGVHRRTDAAGATEAAA